MTLDTQLKARFPGLKLSADITVAPYELHFDAPGLQLDSIRQTGFWERHLTFYLATHLRPRHTFFDIGANVGYYTLLASKLVGDEPGRVVSFEPQPAVFEALEGNIHRNGCDNVVAVQEALGAAPGGVELILENGESDSAYVSARQGAIPSTTLDHFCDSRGILPSVIKCDAQGLDLEIVAGGFRCIERARPLIVLEFHPKQIKERSAVSMSDTFAMLNGLGYVPHFLRGHTYYACEMMSFEILSDLAELWSQHRPKAFLDLVLIPPRRR